MLASRLPPSFLDTYSVLTSSLGFNALCMVIGFIIIIKIIIILLSYVFLTPALIGDSAKASNNERYPNNLHILQTFSAL